MTHVIATQWTHIFRRSKKLTGGAEYEPLRPLLKFKTRHCSLFYFYILSVPHRCVSSILTHTLHHDTAAHFSFFRFSFVVTLYLCFSRTVLTIRLERERGELEATAR